MYRGVSVTGEDPLPHTLGEAALATQEADVLVGGAIMQYDRGLITDLTFPFQYAPTAMLIR